MDARALSAMSKSYAYAARLNSAARQAHVILKRDNATETKMPTTQAMVRELEAQINSLEKLLNKRAKNYSLEEQEDDIGDAADDAPEPDEDEFDDESDDGDDEDRKVRKRHKFEALTDFVANRDGLTKSKAMEIARRDYPDVYASYQAAPVAKSYDALVDAEIKKGCSPTVAAQRVGYAFPDLAKSSIAKSKSNVVEFVKCVDQIQARDDCSRTEALSKARLEHPTAFAKFQNV
jgi:hypothetical protein